MYTLKIIGYVLTFLGYLSYWIGRFFRKKSNMMVFNSLSSFFYIFSHYIFGSINGVINSILVVLRGFAVNYKDKTKKNLIPLYICFMIAFTLNCIFFWKGFSSIFLTICMYINVTANWFFDAQKLRIATCIASVFYILFMIFIGNYVGAILELTIIASNLVSYIKYKKFY